MKKRVLVIDHDAGNLVAAKKQLGQDYDLVTVSKASEARKLLTPQKDYELSRELMKKKLAAAGLSEEYNPWRDEADGAEGRKALYEKLSTEAAKQATTFPAFDIVMTDNFMPAERDGQGTEGLSLVGQMIPVGLVLAIMALKANVATIIIASRDNHHAHPITWAMDAILGGHGRIKCGCEKVEVDGKYVKDWKKTLEVYSDPELNAFQKVAAHPEGAAIILRILRLFTAGGYSPEKFQEEIDNVCKIYDEIFIEPAQMPLFLAEILRD